MSEYSDEGSISKFIGSNPGFIGYDDNKYTLSTIKDNPNSVIILDEIDKSHPKIINIIYNMIENGKIKDSKNNIINLKNNIIIMTTNTNYEENKIGFNKNTQIISNNPITKNVYDIIKFNSLTKENISKIINIKLEKLKEKYKNVNIDINNKVIEELIIDSDYQIYGAKKIDNIISKKIESIIIDSIIDNKKDLHIDSIFSM